MSSPGSNPDGGNSSPSGTDSETNSPVSFSNVPFIGSKSTVPARAKAMTVSGDVTNASVDGSPSFRLGKFRL